MSQPEVIDGLQFAQGAATLKGVLGPSHLPRLAELRCTTDGLSYVLSGRTDAEGGCWLEASANGTLIMECQRCLGPLEVPLALRSELLLAASEREIAVADDAIDRVLADKEMDVCRLVEDEVLLVLPMAPRHEDCGGKRGDGASERTSPFAGLGKLKGTHSP